MKKNKKLKKKQIKLEKLIKEFEELYLDHHAAYYGGFKPSFNGETLKTIEKTLDFLKKEKNKNQKNTINKTKNNQF